MSLFTGITHYKYVDSKMNCKYNDYAYIKFCICVNDTYFYTPYLCIIIEQQT